MLIPHFLSLIGSNFIWSILGKLIKLVGVLYHRHLSLDQAMKLCSLDEHRPYGYKESAKGLPKLLPSELRVWLQTSPKVMPPIANGFLKLVRGKVDLLIIITLDKSELLLYCL